MWFGLNLRALKSTVGGFPRPLLDLSESNFAKIMNSAFGYELNPPFNPYLNSINYMLASYVVPYVGLNGYRGSNRFIEGYISKDVGTFLIYFFFRVQAFIHDIQHHSQTINTLKFVCVCVCR